MSVFSRTAARLMLCAGLCASPWALAQPAPGSAASAPATPAAAAAPAAVAGADGRGGTFKAVQGDVTVVRGNVRSAALVGGPVYATDRLITGTRSAAAFTLRDDSVLSVGPDTVVDLSRFEFDATTQDGSLLVDLLRGSLRVVTGLIAKLKPEQVKVLTPTTVIGVRGTDFIVEEKP